MEEMKIPGERKKNHTNWLLIILMVYGSASLLHFIHNGVFIEEYPNLPGWISTAGVYITWLGITTIGVVGYLLFRYGQRFIGLMSCAIYGAIGLDGLAHYSLAPMSAHTLTMNLTIWLEAITAIIVLIAVTRLMVNHFKRRSGAIFD